MAGARENTPFSEHGPASSFPRTPGCASGTRPVGLPRPRAPFLGGATPSAADVALFDEMLGRGRQAQQHRQHLLHTVLLPPHELD